MLIFVSLKIHTDSSRFTRLLFVITMVLFHIAYSLLIVVVLNFGIGSSIAAVVLEEPYHVVETPDNVCKTLTCNRTASEILHNMDNRVNPCDNFYKFACGGFLQKNNIPDDETMIDAFSITESIIANQVKNIIEEPSSSNESQPFRLAKNFYKSCMNQEIIESRRYEPLKKKLKELGGWPVLVGPEWNETNFNWIESIYKFRKVGYTENYFLNLFVDINSKNTNEKVLVLDQPSVANWRSDMIEGMNNTHIQAYYKFMVDIAVMLGASRDNAIAELRESLDFEIELAKITLSASELRNATLLYNPMTVTELSNHYPSIPWKEYINNILAPHVTIDDNEIVIVKAPKVISDFIKLMNQTSKRIQANYVMWKAARYSVDYVLTKDMLNRSLEYMRDWNGVIKPHLQWKRCLHRVSNLLSTHALYVRKYFKESAKNSVIELVDDIKNIFHKILRTIDWMDNETKTRALEKAAAISAIIGYPDELVNDTKLEELYKNLEFNHDSYLENQLKLKLFQLNCTYRDFKQPISDNNWMNYGHVITVDAYYHQPKNSIIFPAGILNGIFFNDHRPKYMNYGAIGMVISHEITHAFDDEGRQLDEHGNLKNWWTSYTNDEYLRKTKCFVDQYSNYTVGEIGTKLNGINSQEENIADNGGLKIAYLAYKDWLKRHGKEQTLPGLKFNSQQMFWISAANMWCSKTRPEQLITDIAYDPHVPYEYRILGSLSNLPEFAQDFNCPIGSKMNPEKKCTFW